MKIPKLNEITDQIWGWPLHWQLTALFCFSAFLLLIIGASQFYYAKNHIRQIRNEHQINFLFQFITRQTVYAIMVLSLTAVGACLLSYYHIKQTKSEPKQTIISEKMPKSALQQKAPAPAQEQPDNNILSLFSTEAESASLEGLKDRYENALNSAYIIRRCLPDHADLVMAIKTALHDELSALSSQQGYSLDQTEAVYNAIVSASEGSYALFYQHTSCDRPEILTIKEQLGRHYASKINNNASLPAPQKKQEEN